MRQQGFFSVWLLGVYLATFNVCKKKDLQVVMSILIQRSAILPYPAQPLYHMVNDVQSYPEFLPWCAKTRLIHADETSMQAEITASRAGLSQSFITSNQLTPHERVEINLVKGPFKHLHGVWEFKQLNEQACKMSLELEFDYSGALIRATLGPLFTHAANSMVDAFCQRAKQLYG